MARLDRLEELHRILAEEEPPVILFCPYCGQAQPIDGDLNTEEMVIGEHSDIAGESGSRHCPGSLMRIPWTLDE